MESWQNEVGWGEKSKPFFDYSMEQHILGLSGLPDALHYEY